MNDPYGVLGISSSATDDEVKKAYRDLVRKYHPDAYKDNPLADLAEEKMKEINEAHDTIQQMRSGGGASGAHYSNASSGSNNPLYQQVRAAITGGNIDKAEQLMKQATTKDAEWYFLTGVIANKKGWLDEAQQNIMKAYQMEPTNMEYRSAVMAMQRNARSFSSGYGSPSFCCCPCDCCTGLICLDCLCSGCF